MQLRKLARWSGFLWIWALAGCAVPPGTSTQPGASPVMFSFGLWGDMPYAKAGDGPKMPALVRSLNQSDIAFSIYDGDIKDGSSRCDDRVYVEALALFNSLRKPVVYVPGDNEWTDCHRLNNGGFDPLERLAYLRGVMYPTPQSLGQVRMPLEHQGKQGEQFVENTRFEHAGLVFVGINMPGSNNNRVMSAEECVQASVRTQRHCDAANAEYLERDTANIAWMQAAFERARQLQAPGLVLVVQADPGFDAPETPMVNESADPAYSGYRRFMDALVHETEQYLGQVLFVHGDTHYFKLDKPLYGPWNLLPNFTRLQTFGSPAVHWVKVSVDPTDPALFQVHPVLVHQP